MRRGYTLIEVMVALVLAAFVVLIAHGVFGTSVMTGRSLTNARQSLDRTSNAHRFLTAAFLSLDVEAASRPFEGRAASVRFGTWLETPDGWFEPAATDIRADGERLVARVGVRPPIVLADSVRAVRFDYLLEPGAAREWIPEWVSSFSAPIGVRMRVYRTAPAGQLAGDTTLFQIKARK